MENDSIKWLIAGLAGALFAVLLFAGSGIAIFMYLKAQMPEEEPIAYDDDSEEEILSGPEQWAKSEAEYNERIAEGNEVAARYGLDTLYETVAFRDDTREVLYNEQNFAVVDERLATLWSTANTPFDRYRYHAIVSDLGELNYNFDPEAVLATLNAWVAQSPENYRPLMLRGSFYISYGWYYRGTSYASEVTPEGMAKYREYHELAWSDLLLANSLNHLDPEIPAAMARAAGGRPEAEDGTSKLAEIRALYEKTLALNPHHVGVRFTLLNYAQPKWFGSWGEMDTILRELEPAMTEFPLLGIVNARAIGMMYDRSRTHKRKWDSGESDRLLAEAYRAQSELTPDSLMLLGNAAHYALEYDDRAAAVAYFRRLGNRFPLGTEFTDLRDFHWWRMNSLVEHSADEGVIGTPQERELLDEALAVEPANSMIPGRYLAYLERTRDDTQTLAYIEAPHNTYLRTGEIGNPPDYTRIKAMALAARSDDYRVQGTDEEKELLDEALNLAPDNAFVRLVYAEHHITADEFDEARVHLEHARTVDPNYLPALHIMGWLSYHQKRWDEGIAYANEFLATEPSPYLTENTDDAKEIIELCEKKKAQGTDSDE